MGSNAELHELKSRYFSEPVPYAVVTPPDYERSAPLPLCLVLMGGGGSRQNLVDTRPLFDSWWAEGVLPPMVLATPSAGMSYYVELPDGSIRWDAFLAEDFLGHLRATCNVSAEASSTAITGISMGGYGALKLAFARPDQFGAVAAIHPILEPGLHDEQIGARNRIHHLSGGPPELIGPGRDPKVVESNNPANRAQANAASIRESGLAIYFEAGDEDFVNAHDGAEFLHRVLWDLDISHDYHLVRGGDHGGPTFIPRMRAAYAWVGSVLTAEPSVDDPAVTAWIDGGMAEAPPAVAPSSTEFLRVVTAQLKPLRDRAAAVDPNTNRRYGVLP